LSSDATAAGLAVDVVVAGICGTILGGTFLDLLCARTASRVGVLEVGRRASTGCRVATAFAALSVPAAFMALATHNAVISFVGLGVAMISLFATMAPCVIAQMESVPPDLRGLAMALTAFGQHALGDLISPGLVGQLADMTGSLAVGMWLLASWTVLGFIFGIFACFISAQRIGEATLPMLGEEQQPQQEQQQRERAQEPEHPLEQPPTQQN